MRNHANLSSIRSLLVCSHKYMCTYTQILSYSQPPNVDNVLYAYWFSLSKAQETINAESICIQKKKDGKCAVFIRWPRKLGSWYYVEKMKWKTTENINSMCKRGKKRNFQINSTKVRVEWRERKIKSAPHRITLFRFE